jgi:hypothetical protein
MRRKTILERNVFKVISLGKIGNTMKTLFTRLNVVYTKNQKRKLLAKKLRKESSLTKHESLAVLSEFERIPS